MNSLNSIALLTAMFAVAYGSDSAIMQCPGQNYEDLQNNIKVMPCGKAKCFLRKGTNITVEFTLTPTYDMHDVTNCVSAVVVGLPFPFIGVTGKSACSQVLRADTLEPSPCPLKAGQKYIYKNVFPIKSMYPETDLKVHWSLLDEDSKPIICFEVPAKITPARKSTK